MRAKIPTNRVCFRCLEALVGASDRILGSLWGVSIHIFNDYETLFLTPMGPFGGRFLVQGGALGGKKTVLEPLPSWEGLVLDQNLVVGAVIDDQMRPSTLLGTASSMTSMTLVRRLATPTLTRGVWAG